MIDLTRVVVGTEIEVSFSGQWMKAKISRGLCSYVPNNLPVRLPDFMAKATEFDCLCSLWIEDYGSEWRFSG
ncbi:MAG: hypothetical protein ACYT04_50485 [Nostoc sp.]